MGYREPSPEELEATRDFRVARTQLDRLEISANYLQHAARLRAESDFEELPGLDDLIGRAQQECLTLKGKLSGHAESRRRPKRSPSRDCCTIYLDECGQHLVGAVDAFDVFVLAAVIIRDDDFAAVDAEWKKWKVDNLGADLITHEPDVRRNRRPFNGKPGREAVAKLPGIIGALDFATIAVVVHRPDYMADYGPGPLDESLPAHGYMMALDFLSERLVLALDGQFGGAIGRVVAESRGPKEDALLQHEFSRLHLEGTSYISPGWFRQQLAPGITFMPKVDNDTGLQMADLAARPIGEKVIDPTITPPRWEVFRDTLCPAQETKNSILGLKVMPWKERYETILES